MGFEIKLIIGSDDSATPEHEKSKTPKVDGNYIYFPYLKDENGDYIETGRKQKVFLSIAEIKLRKPGPGALVNLYDENKKLVKKNIVYKWIADGDTLEEEDCYGNKKVPVSIPKVIKALKKDNKPENYCRFDWALALLTSIEKTSPGQYSVIIYGY